MGLSLEPEDIHGVDSPDFILWVKVTLRLFEQDIKLRIPILVEAEKGGIYGGALDDLKKFTNRMRHPIELPMLVVAEAGYCTREEKTVCSVNIVMTQIPVRLLQYV